MGVGRARPAVKRAILNAGVSQVTMSRRGRFSSRQSSCRIGCNTSVRYDSKWFVFFSPAHSGDVWNGARRAWAKFGANSFRTKSTLFSQIVFSLGDFNSERRSWVAKSTIVWGTLCLEGASLVIHARKRSTVPNVTLIGTVHWLIAGCSGWNTALTFTLLCACL